MAPLLLAGEGIAAGITFGRAVWAGVILLSTYIFAKDTMKIWDKKVNPQPDQPGASSKTLFNPDNIAVLALIGVSVWLLWYFWKNSKV